MSRMLSLTDTTPRHSARSEAKSQNPHTSNIHGHKRFCDSARYATSAQNDGLSRFLRARLPGLALIALTAFTTTTLAQSTGSDYRLVRHVTAAGGGESSNGSHTLRATLGQAEAAAQPMQGGGFTLRSGYWIGTTGDDPGTPGDDPIFSDGFEPNAAQITGGTP